MDKELGKDTSPISFGGKDYQMGPITLGLSKDFVKRFRYKELEEFLEVSKDMPQEIIVPEMKEIRSKCSSLKSDEVFERYTSTEEGIIYLLYLRLNACDPSVTIKDVESIQIEDLINMSDEITDLGLTEDQKKRLEEMQQK